MAMVRKLAMVNPILVYIIFWVCTQSPNILDKTFDTYLRNYHSITNN